MEMNNAVQKKVKLPSCAVGSNLIYYTPFFDL